MPSTGDVEVPASRAKPAEDKREPQPVAPAPKLGATVRDSAPAVAAPIEHPRVTREPEAKAPVRGTAVKAGKPRAPDAALVRPQEKSVPPAQLEAQAAPPAPKLGAAVREAAGPVPASARPREPEAKAPAAPVLGRAAADLVKAPAVPMLLKPVFTVASPPAAGGLGEVVRDLVKAPAPVLPVPESKPVKVPEPAKVPAPMVEQSFTFAPSIKLDVRGDVKDPEQVVRELEPPLRRLFEAFQREVKARMSSTQLFDQPHV